MRLRVLGCDGGVGSGAQTTALLLGNNILIDAGTGVGHLTLDEMVAIDHVFVTHAHLDHVAFIPFLVDAVGSRRARPVTIHAIQATLDILRNHLFNNLLWPDFTRIPDTVSPYLCYNILQPDQTVRLDGCSITPVPANHTIPAIGYWLDSGRASLVFTGDTTTHDALWVMVNRIENLKYLIIESAFSEHNRDIAIKSKHLYPGLLAEELEKLERPAEIWITHLKPGEAKVIMHEIQQCAGQYRPRRLECGQLLEF